MIIKKLEVGPIMANCFILGCDQTREAAVIDPGDDADRILMALAKDELKVKYLINTHGHFDHVGANKRMKEATGAKIACHPDDEPMLVELSRSAAMFGLSAIFFKVYAFQLRYFRILDAAFTLNLAEFHIANSQFAPTGKFFNLVQ